MVYRINGVSDKGLANPIRTLTTTTHAAPYRRGRPMENFERVTFDHWLSLVYAANAISKHSVYELESHAYGRPSWHGTSTFDEAIRLATYGWSEGARRIARQVDLTQSRLPSFQILRELKMSPVGPGGIDMGRYVQGHPEPYITWPQIEEDTGSMIKINFNVGTSQAFSAEDMFVKGAAACALIDALENQNNRVELHISHGSEGESGFRWEAVTKIKDFQDPVDMDRIAFALANAACARRLGFSLKEQSLNYREIGAYRGGSYGIPIDVKLEGALNIPASQYGMIDDMESWIRRVLEEYGVSLS